jgi:hypothetical protein
MTEVASPLAMAFLPAQRTVIVCRGAYCVK